MKIKALRYGELDLFGGRHEKRWTPAVGTPKTHPQGAQSKVPTPAIGSPKPATGKDRSDISSS